MKRYRKTLVATGCLSLSALIAGVIFVQSYSFDAGLFDKAQGGPLVIVDRRGAVLRQVPSADGRPGREAWVRLSDVSSLAIQTLLASEDQSFYEHLGVDGIALGRAALLTATTQRRYGGSTLSMQLARMVHAPGPDRSVWKKLLQMRAALGIERNMSKQEILEQYLNRAYYGNGAYGIEAASRRYFAKPAKSLSVGEATLLVVLPRNPAYYDPIKHHGRALKRRAHLFKLLERQGRLSDAQASRAQNQELDLALRPFAFEAPHFVDHLLSTLPQEVKDRGGKVFTTLDLELQRSAEKLAQDHLLQIKKWDFENVGAVVLDARTAEVLAMVGSSDYHQTQINIATWKRYPGSALKPFVYGAALEAGKTPADIAYDVKDISTEYRMPDSKEHGPTPYRIALGSSYNFAAVHVIEQIGEERVMNKLRRAGISEFPQKPQSYGSRLALGSTRVRLLDLAAGYRAFVHEGRVRSPSLLTKVVRSDGVWAPPTDDEQPVFPPEVAWLTMDMLSDPEARRPMFGHETPADLPYRVVAKTGTAEGFSDTLAVFATREYLVGVWAGRLDGGSTQGHAAMTTAAPLARAVLLAASGGAELTLPDRPAGLVKVDFCPASGMRPGPGCKHRVQEWVKKDALSPALCNWHTHSGALHYPERLRPWLSRQHRIP